MLPHRLKSSGWLLAGLMVSTLLVSTPPCAGQITAPAARPELVNPRPHVKIAGLGIEFQPLTAELAQAFELPSLQQTGGALVLWIQPGSPAAAAELAAGEIILSIDDTPVNDPDELLQLLQNIPTNQTVTLDVWRFGERDKHTLTLPEASAVPKFETDSRADTAASYENNPLRLGVADLDHDLRQAFGNRGVLVEGVAPGPASIAGIEAGDSLLMIGRLNVANAAQFNGLVKSLPKGKPLPVLIERDGRMRFVVISLPE
jgi:serine protease Do